MTFFIYLNFVEIFCFLQNELFFLKNYIILLKLKCPSGGSGLFCCLNGADNPDCCSNGGKGQFCCSNGANNPDCCSNGGKGLKFEISLMAYF